VDILLLLLILQTIKMETDVVACMYIIYIYIYIYIYIWKIRFSQHVPSDKLDCTVDTGDKRRIIAI